MLYCHSIDTPIGGLWLVADRRQLRCVLLPRHGTAQPISSSWQCEQTPLLRRAAAQFRAWFRDPRQRFELPLMPPQQRGTPFQCQVWDAIAAIPCGESASYGELAQGIGAARAARAVGSACGANPLPLIVPCHRVLRADGSLGGFSGGDLDTKAALLAMEAER